MDFTVNITMSVLSLPHCEHLERLGIAKPFANDG